MLKFLRVNTPYLPIARSPIIHCAGVEEFVEMFVTDGRLDQGLREASEGRFNPRFIGPFVNWIANDVEKESKVELAKANLTFGQVKGQVINKARTWYMAQLPKDKH